MMPMAQTWYVYLIECKNGRLYTGIAVDLAARFAKHQRCKGAMFTRLNPVLRMLAAKPFVGRADASKAEHQMKRLTAAQKRVAAAEWPLQVGLPCIQDA
jgi:putative endonuclease